MRFERRIGVDVVLEWRVAVEVAGAGLRSRLKLVGLRAELQRDGVMFCRGCQ